MILSSGKVMFSGVSVCLSTCQRVSHVTITYDALDLTVQRFLARNLAFLTGALTAQEPFLPCAPAQSRNLTLLYRNHQPPYRSSGSKTGDLSNLFTPGTPSILVQTSGGRYPFPAGADIWWLLKHVWFEKWVVCILLEC